MPRTSAMEQKSIRELVDNVKHHLEELGYRLATIDRMDAEWKKLIEYADARGISTFSIELGRSFVWEICGSILGDKDTSQNLNRAIHVLADFEQYGMVFKQSSATLKGFGEGYKELFTGFLEHLRWSGMAEGSVMTWRGRLFRFEYFLQNNGITDFSQIEAGHVHTYVESLSGFSASTIGGTIRVLRKLFDYAIQNGYHHKNHVDTLPDVRRPRQHRLPVVFSPEEVERILANVDTSNAMGKRDYAILLLVAKLGLRIVDARGLKFENIDWQNKTISIVQRKTGVPLALPLFDDIGWAIIDYMKAGRPQTSCQYIFVRHVAPFNEFKSSLQVVVQKYVRKAGIKTPANKPVGMHTFRHSVATALLKNGAKYTDIAQVLGHACPESAEAYLSLDVDQLRQCALEVDI